jgi:hypothetical protein
MNSNITAENKFDTAAPLNFKIMMSAQNLSTLQAIMDVGVRDHVVNSCPHKPCFEELLEKRGHFGFCFNEPNDSEETQYANLGRLFELEDWMKEHDFYTTPEGETSWHNTYDPPSDNDLQALSDDHHAQGIGDFPAPRMRGMYDFMYTSEVGETSIYHIQECDDITNQIYLYKVFKFLYNQCSPPWLGKFCQCIQFWCDKQWETWNLDPDLNEKYENLPDPAEIAATLIWEKVYLWLINVPWDKMCTEEFCPDGLEDFEQVIYEKDWTEFISKRWW